MSTGTKKTHPLRAKAEAAKNAEAAKKSPTPDPKGARPGTKDDKAEKKPKKKRVPHPSLIDSEGEPVKLKEAPADFDPKLHKPLTRKDFADEIYFYEYRADQCEEQAKKFRQQAEEARKLGSTKDRAKAKRLKSWMEKAAQIRAELIADGIDVDSLIDGADIDAVVAAK